MVDMEMTLKDKFEKLLPKDKLGGSLLQGLQKSLNKPNENAGPQEENIDEVVRIIDIKPKIEEKKEGIPSSVQDQKLNLNEIEEKEIEIDPKWPENKVKEALKKNFLIQMNKKKKEQEEA